MGNELSGRVALVTGGAQGIGEATCHLLAARGAIVVIGDVQEERGLEVARDIVDKGHSAQFVAADVARQDGINVLVDVALRDHGRIDIVVNNAMRWSSHQELVNLTDERWEQDMLMLLGSYFRMTRAVAQHLRSGASVINISSVHGLLATPGWGTYDIAKAALIQLTRVAAAELGPHGVRVNAIAPGIIARQQDEALYEASPATLRLHETITPLRRVGRPNDVAAVIGFLASDDAAFVTGQLIVVDGGLTTVLQLAAAEQAVGL